MNRASRVRIGFPHVVKEIEACPFSGSVEDLPMCCAVLREDLEEVVMNGSQGMRSPFLWPFVVVLLSSLEERFLEVLSFLMDENDVLNKLELGSLCSSHTEKELSIGCEQLGDCKRFISRALRGSG